jgi:hypothetical protein
MSYSFANDISCSFKLELEIVRDICSVIDTPRSLTVWLLLSNHEVQQYLDLTIDSSTYEDVSNFADDYLVTEILKKSPNLPISIDRADIALKSFLRSEVKCNSTNERLLSTDLPEWIHSFSRNIGKILGPLSHTDVEFVQDQMRFGPGASTGVRGVGSTASDKYDEEIHLTAGLMPFVRSILGERWWEHQNTCHTVIEGNRFTTVPKNAKTDRGICVEPTLNMYVQLGIGALIRRKLRHFGIDLSDQTKNREMAKRAFADNLSTIDLSAASDSLAWSLVNRFFPERWTSLLDLPRSPFTKLPCGNYVELEKYSSMGNGYTFELETLVFYAVCMTFVPFSEMIDVSVYGDDIIVPYKYSAAVIDALEFLGFGVNTSKSFLAGNFFESCGTDWFKGHNVRPFYLRGVSGEIPYTLSVANGLRLYASRIMDNQFCDARYRSIWLKLYKSTPIHWRKCKVPSHFGDVGFIVSRQEAQHVKRASYGIEGYVVLHMVQRPKKRRKKTLGLLLSILAKRVPPEFSIDTRGFEPIRGYLRIPVPRKTICFKWSCGLDWLL